MAACLSRRAGALSVDARNLKRAICMASGSKLLRGAHLAGTSCRRSSITSLRNVLREVLDR